MVTTLSMRLDASAVPAGTEEGLEGFWRVAGRQPILEGQGSWIPMLEESRSSGVLVPTSRE